MTWKSLAGSGTVGGWCTIPSSYGAEIMAHGGFDWICIDMQHGLIGRPDAVAMLQAAAAAGTPALVRVPWNDDAAIMFALDAGAAGVIVPMVNNASEAKAAVSAAKYPPVGARSWGPSRAVWNLPEFTPQAANASTVCLVQIETKEAVETLDEILAIDGIDGIYLGPADLALSLGHPPTLAIDEMPHLDIISDVVRRTLAAGRLTAAHSDGPTTAAALRRLGVQHLTIATDASLVARGATEARSEWNRRVPA